MSFKLLLILLLVLVVVMMMKRPTRSNPGAPTRAVDRATSSLRGTVTIVALRALRGVVAVITLVTVLVAFKFMLIFGASAQAVSVGNTQDFWVATALLMGIGVLLYFLFWTSARMRRRINQLHRDRGNVGRPLLARVWSL